MLKFLCFSLALIASTEAKELKRDKWQTTVNGVPIPPERSGELIFEDDFDFLDLYTWQHEKTASGGGNWEFQIYQNNRTNSFVDDEGFLHIVPTLTEDQYGEGFCNNGRIDLHGGWPADECTNPSFYGCERIGNGGTTINPTLSARLRTVNSFSFKYGTMEVRARMPRGDWIWPAIWMLPRMNAFGGWPASGEIDLVEARGNEQFQCEGKEQGHKSAGSTLHFGPFWPVNGWSEAHGEMIHSGGGFGTDFVTYRLEWTPEYIAFFYDDVEVKRVVPPSGGFWELYDFDTFFPGVSSPWFGDDISIMTPFDQEFYIILNVAVGGTNGFFPEGCTNMGYNKPWSNTSPNAMNEFLSTKHLWYPTWNKETDPDQSAMLVDYVRVWAL
ncbi:unnamed protein product [Cyprideis torosa]|uniref:Uncharacterized protein n=1 Tax=Cyprideis torosa TaxID=163714 RepID=A0A7R8W533_9CRUS|nr:unnamed protein product [Cyprideis torosa]CAG0884835.1 unnamed protein product [Cyprideis torosa]